MNAIYLIIFMCLINIISTDTIYILIDNLFHQIEITNPVCLQKNPAISSHRGKIENLEEIFHNKEPEKNIYNNDFVFISGKDKLKYVKYFSSNTIFFTDFQIFWSDIKEGICYVQLEKWSKYNYVILAPSKLGYILFPLCIFLFADSIPIAIFELYKSELKRLVMFKKLHFYKFAQRLSLFWIAIIISSFTIYFFLLSYIIYSFYKAYLVINLIVLLEGYSIIHFNKSSVKFAKYFLIFFIYDSLFAIYSEYIVYFFPKIDNFYLLHIKSLFEHLAFLLMIFIYIFKRYVHMKKQHSLEEREKTILAKGYKIKINLYRKLMIFSIVYSCTFIALPFLEKLYIGIDDVVETYYVNYLITITLETIFNLALTITLYPKDLTIYFFLPTIFDYNTFKMETKIKKRNEEKLRISNLTYDVLKNKYEEKQYPLVFINPFTKTDQVFKDIRVAFINKKKVG